MILRYTKESAMDKLNKEIITGLIDYRDNPSQGNALAVAQLFEQKLENVRVLGEEGLGVSNFEATTTQTMTAMWFNKAGMDGKAELYAEGLNGPSKGVNMYVEELLYENSQNNELGPVVNAFGYSVLYQQEEGMDALQDKVISAMNNWKPHASLDDSLTKQFAAAIEREALPPEPDAPNISPPPMSLDAMSA